MFVVAGLLFGVDAVDEDSLLLKSCRSTSAQVVAKVCFQLDSGGPLAVWSGDTLSVCQNFSKMEHRKEIVLSSCQHSSSQVFIRPDFFGVHRTEKERKLSAEKENFFFSRSEQAS